MSMNVIEITQLSKNYDKNIALKNINLSISRGDCILFVGHNGSGKSTLLKCILNHISYRGSIFCLDNHIGYIPEKALLPDFMTVSQFLIELDRLKSMIPSDINELLLRYQLMDKKDQVISSLSKGMRQKLLIMQAMLGCPQLLLFDEPLNGLDEIAKRCFMNDIQSLLDKKSTIIITTHYPEQYILKQKRIVEFHQGVINEVY